MHGVCYTESDPNNQHTFIEGLLQGTLGVQPTGLQPTGSGKLGYAGPLYW